MLKKEENDLGRLVWEAVNSEEEAEIKFPLQGVISVKEKRLMKGLFGSFFPESSNFFQTTVLTEVETDEFDPLNTR
jgi:hypothetical protein